MAFTEINILIGGQAGQGLVTIGELLSKVLVRSGYFIVVTQSYESRIRGGHNTFAIRAAVDQIHAPAEGYDLLIALDETTLKLHEHELKNGGIIVGDKSFCDSKQGRIGVPFKELSDPRRENIMAFGIIATLLGLEKDKLEQMIRERFCKKAPEECSLNIEAFEKAVSWALSNDGGSLKIAPSKNPGRRMMLCGNEAIALGAVSAGIKFYSFYPMTPSTSIGLNLASFSDKAGIVVEQAEDEIAAINMAIGASYAGAVSMVATSGGGFALMVEGVSLAAMTETPIVIALAQRPAPATGLPTRTEQADLEFVLHSGHGEFPRAVFAPGSVEECFHLTRKAFHLAEKYQGPIFILTDQFLADSFRSVEMFDGEPFTKVAVGADIRDVKLPYRRYEVTPSGISPRLLPGLTEHLVVADSDEHTPDGHLTEDLVVRSMMVEKRLRKTTGLYDETLPPELFCDGGSEILFVCWGSTRGAVLEVVLNMKQQGKNASMLYFNQVWPLNPDHFLNILKSAREVISVEGNASAQFARLIRRETGFSIEKKILRYDGLPMTPCYIREELEELGL